MALDKATIINLDTKEAIRVLFNPEEYTLDLGNTIAEIGIPGVQKSPVQYVRGNVRTLRMELFFDTYEQNEDVRVHTRRITALLEPTRRPWPRRCSCSPGAVCSSSACWKRSRSASSCSSPAACRCAPASPWCSRSLPGCRSRSRRIVHRAADGAQPRRGRDVEPAGA